MTLAEIGGLRVGIDAPEDWVRAIVGYTGGHLSSPDGEAPDLTVEVAEIEGPPARAADGSDGEGHRAWWDGERLWLQGGGVQSLAARTPAPWLGFASTSERTPDVFRFFQYGLAWLLAEGSRALLHCAVVARGDSALLVVGRTGQGKSTMAWAAARAGWDVICDDLAIVCTDHRVTVHGLGRDLMVPADHVEGSDRPGVPPIEGDPRRRRFVPSSVLASGSRTVVGVVAVEHGDEEGHHQAVGPADRSATLMSGLAVPAFPPVVRLHQAVVARLAELPMWVVAHARDASMRLERAAERLDQVLAAVAG